MDHVETKDPFGFVGSHVVRKGARGRGEEHGWLTRYDDALDCYTLFVPGGGEPRLLPRGEVMKFLAAPNIELHDDDQEAFPPPVRDEETSRYLGVALRRPGENQTELRGEVSCFLPFADRYQVQYEDGTSEELSESAVIDGMIALLKTPFFSPPQRKSRSQRRTRSSNSSEDEELPPRTRRKRQRVEKETEAEQIPAATVAVVDEAASEERKEDDEDVVETPTADAEMQPAPNILEVMNNLAAGDRVNSLEHASGPADAPPEINDGEIADPDVVEEIQADEMPQEGRGAETTPEEQVTAPPTPTKEVPFYLIEKMPHAATEPLAKRSLAFELLRAQLLNLLDRREASSVKIALQYDILRNTDVRDRDAVIRFVEADGLVVLNHLLNTFAADVLADSEEEETKDASDEIEQAQERLQRDDELLLVLKIVAMLPTPSRSQIISSNIGITIKHLTRRRGPPGRQTLLPRCIIDLAKWIKATWIRMIPPEKKKEANATPETRQAAPRSQQQARRGGRGGATGRPSRQLNRRQSPPAPPAETRAPVDNTLIQRIARRPAPPSHQPAPAAAAAPPPAPRRVTGGLKPDWMRQKENLSRSRFCIDDNTNVDTRLYRDSRTRPITNVPVVEPEPPRASNQDQSEDAGGPDGVFGRPQRLRFGKRWSRQEFQSQDPPGLLTQPPSSYGRSQYPQHYDNYEVHVPPVRTRRAPPRSILRRVSRYNDQPVIESPEH